MNTIKAIAISMICLSVAVTLTASERASGLIPDVPNLNPTRSDPGYNTPAGRDWIREEFNRQWKGRFDPEVYLPFI